MVHLNIKAAVLKSTTGNNQVHPTHTRPNKVSLARF